LSSRPGDGRFGEHQRLHRELEVDEAAGHVLEIVRAGLHSARICRAWHDFLAQLRPVAAREELAAQARSAGRGGVAGAEARRVSAWCSQVQARLAW